MVNWFLLDHDLTISDDAFNYIMSQLDDPHDSMLWKIARHRKILGFTDEDLYSLMYMQVHQVLRRGMYDPRRSPRAFFSTVFNKMLNDMNRRKDVALKEGDIDALDLYLPYDDNKDSLRMNQDTDLFA